MRNEMMHRPVVKEELVDFMRTKQKKLSGELGLIEEEAHLAEVPIIPHETSRIHAVFIRAIKTKECFRNWCSYWFFF